MPKKIIINEAQMLRLESRLFEEASHSIIIKMILNELELNYEPITKFMREGGEYFEKKMIIVKADKEIISPKSLFEYLKSKYKVKDELLKQIISDWVFSRINKDGSLSKNISLR